MNDAALAGQVERLARSVRRWRLATFVFAGLFLCSIATGVTVVTLWMLQFPEQQQQMQQVIHRAEQAEEMTRNQAMLIERTQHALVEEQDARRRLETARKNGENGP